MNKKQAMTSDRMFLGAFVNAYSRPVIEANISLIAIRMYLILKITKNNQSVYLEKKSRVTPYDPA